MKIVDYKEFLDMPQGTMYARYEDGQFGAIRLKGVVSHTPWREPRELEHSNLVELPDETSDEDLEQYESGARSFLPSFCQTSIDTSCEPGTALFGVFDEVDRLRLISEIVLGPMLESAHPAMQDELRNILERLRVCEIQLKDPDCTVIDYHVARIKDTLTAESICVGATIENPVPHILRKDGMDDTIRLTTDDPFIGAIVRAIYADTPKFVRLNAEYLRTKCSDFILAPDPIAQLTATDVGVYRTFMVWDEGMALAAPHVPDLQKAYTQHPNRPVFESVKDDVALTFKAIEAECSGELNTSDYCQTVLKAIFDEFTYAKYVKPILNS